MDAITSSGQGSCTRTYVEHSWAHYVIDKRAATTQEPRIFDTIDSTAPWRVNPAGMVVTLALLPADVGACGLASLTD